MPTARARDEAEDAVGEFLQHVERQGTVDRAEVNAVGDSAIDAGATSYLISKSTTLQTQRRLHDEAFVLIAKCLDLENQASNAAALLECQACYEQGLAKFSEAFSLRFTQEENVVARLLSEKMQRTNLMVAERLRMLQRQSTRAPRSVLASVELHPESFVSKRIHSLIYFLRRTSLHGWANRSRSLNLSNLSSIASVGISASRRVMSSINAST